MSTHYGYRCNSHTPYIDSEHWFNHGDDLLRDTLQIFRHGDWPVYPEGHDEAGDPLPVEWGSYMTKYPLYWLRQHPDCEVVVVDEYGREDGQTFDDKLEADLLACGHASILMDASGEAWQLGDVPTTNGIRPAWWTADPTTKGFMYPSNFRQTPERWPVKLLHVVKP